ncbi:MAG: hypothetical protein R3C10_18590 [Pirellulales bacterium]
MIRNYFVGTMAASVVTLFGTCALAQHEGDIEFGTDASGGALIVAGWVFEGEFGDFGTSFFTDEPGFEAVEAVEGDLFPLAEGDEVGFNVLSSLLYWDGTMKTIPVNEPELEISAGFSTVVTPTSGPMPGFLFGTADMDGGIHQHLDFTLTPGADAGSGAAPLGPTASGCS